MSFFNFDEKTKATGFHKFSPFEILSKMSKVYFLLKCICGDWSRYCLYLREEIYVTPTMGKGCSVTHTDYRPEWFSFRIFYISLFFLYFLFFCFNIDWNILFCSLHFVLERRFMCFIVWHSLYDVTRKLFYYSNTGFILKQNVTLHQIDKDQPWGNLNSFYRPVKC